MKKLNCVYFFLFVLCFSSYCQIKLDQPVPVDPSVKVGKLPNGLTYYIRKNPKPEKKVELRLVVNAGSILEENDQRGLAHFMEHMSFNGSKHFPKNELVDYLQKVGVQFGADLNAYTSFDETVYILPISSDNPEVLEKGFTVLEDWAFNNLLDKTEINKERGVVLEESRLSKGAQERMRRQYFPALFNGSRYAERLPIGKDSILRAFNPVVLQRFYKQWYRPDLMAVVVVGDIDPALAEQKIRSHFASFKNPVNEKKRPALIPIQARVRPEAMVLTDEEATNAILQVFNFVRPEKKVKTWKDYREKTVQDLVTSIISLRLQELTQKENPPFVYGYTGMTQFIRGYEAFTSFAVLRNGSAKQAVDALLAETNRARKYGFLPSELERAKANLLNEAENAFKERDKSESGNLVGYYINNFLEGEPVPGAEQRLKFIQQVLPTISLNEINEVATKMPATNNAFALLTAPASMKDKLPSSADLLKELIQANNQEVKPYEEKAIAKSLMENEPVPGTLVKETTDSQLGTTDLTFGNGITITIKPTTFKNDQIIMDAWRWGGFQRFPLEDMYNAKHAAEATTVMGVKEFSPTDLEKFLSGKTVEAQPYLNDYEEGIQGGSSVKDFETFLQLVNLYFTQPRKDETLFHSYVTKQASSLQFLKQNPRIFFQDTLTKLIYNSNPWANRIPTSEEYTQINLDRAIQIYKQVFSNADGIHFTFVGNIDVNTAKPLLLKYLGSLPGKAEEHMYKDNGFRPVKGIIDANFKKGKEQQSIISVLFSGETQYSREENMAFQALIEVLNIKVIEKLREEMSGIYGGGFGGAIQKRPYVHYTLAANLPCGPENVDKLTTALFELIKNIQEKGPEQKDLDKVKETWRKQYQVSMQSNDAWLSNLSEAFIDKTDPHNILDYEQKLNALTVSDVQKAAQKYLTMNNYVKAVLYPESAKVNEGVKKAF
ncbi:MAG: M16 family metallopeptidase [Flavisolibacter sp.]